MDRIIFIRRQRSVVVGISSSLELRASLQAAIPSLWEILAYNEEASSVNRRLPVGTCIWGKARNLLRESVGVPDIRRYPRCKMFQKKSMKRDIFFVGAPLKDTMGPPGQPGLWIFRSR